MKIAILLGVVMIAFAVIIRTGWRPSMPNVSWSWGRALLTIVVLVLLLGMGSCSYGIYRRATTPPTAVEFPISGEGQATKDGLKAWLDPMRTYLRATRPARYVFVENPKVFFDDLGPIGENKEEWFKKPAGKYTVTPIGTNGIYFRWSQNKID